MPPLENGTFASPTFLPPDQFASQPFCLPGLPGDIFLPGTFASRGLLRVTDELFPLSVLYKRNLSTIKILSATFEQLWAPLVHLQATSGHLWGTFGHQNQIIFSLVFCFSVCQEKKPVPDGNCGSGWSKVENRCIYISNSKVRWYDAKVACKNLNANLFEPKNHQANLLVNTRMQAKPFWVGIRDINKYVLLLPLV